MREIKFRGIKISQGTMVYGYFSGFVNDGKLALIGNPKDNGDTGWWVNKETVGQFTGLLDKNGKEIYEGDILKYHLEDSVGSYDGTAAVFYYEDGFCIETGESGYCPYLCEVLTGDAEVIGNIYENPELLENENS